MNILTPVSEIMTTNLITVHPKDSLYRLKEIFDEHKIHHIPVVEFKKLVGLISKTDLLYFIKGAKHIGESEKLQNAMRLTQHKVEDLMTTRLAVLEPRDTIRTALEVFKANLFHALPIVENEALVGIITTYDLLDFFSKETIALSDYESSKS
ncbi:MAG: CBS domain-containing protein [Bacteroidota bacterium]